MFGIPLSLAPPPSFYQYTLYYQFGHVKKGLGLWLYTDKACKPAWPRRVKALCGDREPGFHFLKDRMDSGKGKGTKVDFSLGQDASNKKDKEKQEVEDEDYVYSSTLNVHPNMERTLFMVDLSRLKEERDTLENALVLYIPEADIKKVSEHFLEGCERAI